MKKEGQSNTYKKLAGLLKSTIADSGVQNKQIRERAAYLGINLSLPLITSAKRGYLNKVMSAAKFSAICEACGYELTVIKKDELKEFQRWKAEKNLMEVSE